MLYISFSVGGHLYGVPILAVLEVSQVLDITPIQGADSLVEGFLNLRGQIVTVLNVGTCLGLAPAPRHTETSRVIILKTNQELSEEAFRFGIRNSDDSIALLVEAVADVVTANETDIQKLPGQQSHPYLTGVFKLENELLTLVSTEKLAHLA